MAGVVSFLYNYVERTNYYFDIQNDKNCPIYDTIKILKIVDE